MQDIQLEQLPDVRPMLNDARRRILRGVHLVFSGVIPLKSGDPSQEPFWQLAEQVWNTRQLHKHTPCLFLSAGCGGASRRGPRGDTRGGAAAGHGKVLVGAAARAFCCQH